MLNKILKDFDWIIFLPTIFICSLSVLVIKSIAPNLLLIHIISMMIGLVLFFLFSLIDYRYYDKLINPIFVLSLLALTVTFIIGLETRGSVRWVELGPIRLQVSELIKPFLIIFFAYMFKEKPRGLLEIFKKIILFLLPFILVFKQPDLGNAVVYLFIFLGILILSGIRFRLIFLGITSVLISFPFLWNILKDYQKQRVITFLTPGSDPLGSGYNALQAAIAVGSGGLWGRGLGWGTQSHLKFLPEYHTDFIFASLAEELGLIGSVILLVLYLVILARILQIATQAQDRPSAMILIGVFIMLLSQVFINVGMNIGLVPITGITLPLVSYGNNSVIATLISLGIVQSISKTCSSLKFRKPHQNF